MVDTLYYTWVAALALTLISVSLYRHYTKLSISHVPGPRSTSFIFGHLRELYQKQAAEIDFEWIEKYGSIIRFKGALGEDRLLVADPRAMQYLYQTSAYRFTKLKVRQEVARSVSGYGLLWADGDTHKRQRRLMLPGFGTPETKAFIPIFSYYASQITTKWRDIISQSGQDSVVLDIPGWASRATLDAFGMAAFDYQFGSMEDSNNVLSKAYVNLFAKTFALPSSLSLFIQDMWQYVPRPILQWCNDHSPRARNQHTKHVAKVATSVASSLVEAKYEAALCGKGNRDIMSLLVQANASANPEARLSDREMMDQMRTLIMAGHETISNSVSWMLYELARQPQVQNILRKEIHETETHMHSIGQTEYTSKDFDNMPYTQAIIKETLRLHPVVYHASRQASQDEILPLSKPIVTETGKVLSELVVPKGTKMITSFAGYNRNKDIFGDDVHDFNPSRWLERDGHVPPHRKLPTIGVYNNLLTFAGGVRACIGWRFAVLEMTSMLIELVGNFEFQPTPASNNVRREACVFMIPTIEGDLDKGKQLPLRVSLAKRD